ncbi:MAG: AraC family transcriptional regulator [Planctomycetota bacterium]
MSEARDDQQRDPGDPLLTCVRLGHKENASEEAASGRDAYERWREATRQVFEVSPRGGLDSFRSESAFYNVDGLIFTRNLFSPCTYTRGRSHTRGSESDPITLHLPLFGQERGVAAGDVFESCPGQISLRDWAHPFDSATEQTDKLGVVIPRDRIEVNHLIYKHAPILSWDVRTGLGHSLLLAWKTVWEGLPRTKTSEAPNVVDVFLEKLNITIADTMRGVGLSKAGCDESGKPTLAVMKQFLDDHLSDPDLGPDMLANAFHCSRATVYRRFDWLGGIHAYIREKRLARCFSELSAPRASSLRVHHVAERWGFSRASHFNRAFRGQYGRSPAEVIRSAKRGERDTPEQEDSQTAGIGMLHDWLDD